MPNPRSFVSELLRAYHNREAPNWQDFHAPSRRQAEYLCDVGLGPIAYRTCGDTFDATNPEVFRLFQSADLTTRLIYRQMESATVELLEQLNAIGIIPTLIKGISTSQEFYSPSYLRLMGDVDVLVGQSDAVATMEQLANLGYETSESDWQLFREKGHHHLPAARNPKTGVTVEVHTELFAPHIRFSRSPFFQANEFDAQKCEIKYMGKMAMRFTPEYQLVFTIAKWAIDGAWAINLTSINDAIHILRQYGGELNWQSVEAWLAMDASLHANFYILMSLLKENDIVAMPPVIDSLIAKDEHRIQPRTRRILEKLLADYPLGGHDKTPDSYAVWRAHAVWDGLITRGGQDSQIPVVLAQTLLRSVHHGKYNPFGLLLKFFRFIWHGGSAKRGRVAGPQG